jgi:Zn-dependent M28 family amino/carboxypeptidase
MDHLGIGPAVGGDSIYNGADDNASGTAALLAIARAFASLPEAPPRTVLFLAVSGEEYGLWGSEYFAAHPPVPVDSIVAAVNLDMISRNSVTTVLVGGLLLSTLGDQATAAAARHPELALAVAPGPAGGSDHVPFAARDIPWIFFFTGLHATYHTPDDEVALTDPNQAARIARLAFYTVHAAASTPERPAWKVGFGAAVP